MSFTNLDDREPSIPCSPNLSRRSLLGLVVVAGTSLACSSSDEASASASPSNGGSSGQSGSANSSGQAGSSAGQAGAGGEAGSSGQAGNAGAAGENAGGQAGTAGGAGASNQCQPLAPNCVSSVTNPLGPYYRAGAPSTTKLYNPLGTGKPFVVSGMVFASDCVTPLAGAIVEVWQADDKGDYDNQIGDPGPNVYNLRAQTKTDACGRYQFETIVPGHYLNGAQFRPAHVHFQVTHPSLAASFVTQLYFKDDPYNSIDPWYQASLEADSFEDAQGVIHGTFHLVLPVS
jgi:catechol 1,2-dioxygenase